MRHNAENANCSVVFGIFTKISLQRIPQNTLDSLPSNSVDGRKCVTRPRISQTAVIFTALACRTDYRYSLLEKIGAVDADNLTSELYYTS